MNVLGIEWTTLQWIMLLWAAVTQRNFAEESRKVDWIYSFMKKQSQNLRGELCVLLNFSEVRLCHQQQLHKDFAVKSFV